VHPSFFLGSVLLESWADEYFILLQKKKRKGLFVGTITIDFQKNNKLLKNMEARRKGETLRYGLMTGAQYPSYDEFEYIQDAYMMQHPLKASGPASEVIRDIVFCADVDEKESPEAFFVKLPDTESVGAGFAKVVLDSKAVSKDYFRLYMNQRVEAWNFYSVENGRFTKTNVDDWLQGCKSELEIIHRLLNTQIHVPDIPTQEYLMRVLNRLNATEAQARALKLRLWTNPDEPGEIETEINTLSTLEGS
jgi:hypothetical protein